MAPRPPDAFQKAVKAKERSASPFRTETRLQRTKENRARFAAGWRPGEKLQKASDDALRALAAEGLPAREIAQRVGMTYGSLLQRLRKLDLSPRERRPTPQVATADLLALRQAGLWDSQIAARTGLTVRAVRGRLRRLQRQGVDVPAPTGPVPNRWRKVSGEDLLGLAREGLRHAEIAARVGITRSNVSTRLAALRRRGLLPVE